MTALTVNCDLCGATIATGRILLTAETVPFAASWQPGPISGRPAIDLCGPCSQALAA